MRRRRRRRRRKGEEECKEGEKVRSAQLLYVGTCIFVIGCHLAHTTSTIF